MPKIIDEAREKILNSAKRMLLEEGYNGISIRRVAQDCSVAVGTIYNYFENKNTLIAYVMMEDWQKALAAMDAGCEKAQDLYQGFTFILEAIKDFAGIYDKVWVQFSQYAGSSGEVNSRHLMLRGQIESRISALMVRLKKQDAVLVPLLAELALVAALQEDISDEHIRVLINRIL